MIGSNIDCCCDTFMMSPLAERIAQRLEPLPESALRKILSIVEFFSPSAAASTQLLTGAEATERLQLVEALWDSVAEHPDLLPVTEAQRQELDYRLEHYAENTTAGSSWDEVKQRLGQSA